MNMIILTQQTNESLQMPLNIEIKAKCSFPEKVHQILKAHHAEYKGVDHQIDTYFKVSNGRMKLREGNIEHSLIHYTRSNQEGPKKSEVILYHPHPDSELKALLTAANEVLVVVDKKRAIYFIENVKFHVDDVKDLGSFVEIEAIDWDGSISETELKKQCDDYMALLGIHSEDLLAISYSDMLLHLAKNEI